MTPTDKDLDSQTIVNAMNAADYKPDDIREGSIEEVGPPAEQTVLFNSTKKRHGNAFSRDRAYIDPRTAPLQSGTK